MIEQERFQQRLYDDEYSSYTKFVLENWRLSYIKRIFEMLSPLKGFFLDIGVGGSGYTVIAGAQHNVISIGVDISREGMRVAKFNAKKMLGQKNSLCDFIACSATHLPFRSGSIQNISMISVLEHILDDKQTIEEISRIVGAKGKIYITVPNSYERVFPLFWIYQRRNDLKVGHLRHYKAEYLVNLFARHRVKVKDVLYHANIFKVLQQLVQVLFTKLNYTRHGLWWVLEDLDMRFKKVPSGMQLSLFLVKE